MPAETSIIQHDVVGALWTAEQGAHKRQGRRQQQSREQFFHRPSPVFFTGLTGPCATFQKFWRLVRQNFSTLFLFCLNEIIKRGPQVTPLRSALYNWPAKIEQWPTDFQRLNMYLKTRPYVVRCVVLPVEQPLELAGQCSILAGQL